ncbi:MAG: tungstate ABC transporter substrate-binding protein WtpA [Candidatus Stahlbacteria bacterium]|nr:tungstate ABC transporter substrate-binding protein WtpA [Candidatus Stahlbacteria bacterium]
MKYFICFFLLLGCSNERGKLIIFHAGSLAKPIKEMADEFAKLHPGIEIQREASGSRMAAQKVSELNRQADIIAVSDFLVIEELLMLKYTGWYAKFAINRMVIAFTDKSKYKDEITSNNWYKILTRPEVNYGRSDHNLDPCGYRTLMVWQLAELYYGEKNLSKLLDTHCPQKNIRPAEIELLPLIETGVLDYAFLYLSIAKQHGLKYVELPREIDLSDPTLDSLYTKVSVKLKNSTVHGEPIVYAITIPNNAPHSKLAVEFVKFVLGAKGQEIMKNNGQPSIVPAAIIECEHTCNEISKVPSELMGQ